MIFVCNTFVCFWGTIILFPHSPFLLCTHILMKKEVAGSVFRYYWNATIYLFPITSHTGEISVIKSVSFRIHKGEFVSIVGPSGCGKSTLLGLLTGILSPEEGSIKIHYKQKGTQSFYGYMLQQDHLLEWYDIWDNVCLGPKINHCLDNACKEYLHTLLTRYQLDSFAHKKPSQLSGGMRQRAALIRTLAMKPGSCIWMNHSVHWITRAV